MALDRAAVKRYPGVSALFQGLGYCAGHAGLHEEAVSAHERALELEPDNQKLVNDLGWTLLQAGHILEASKTLEHTVSMDPSDRLPQENLRICRSQAARTKLG
jgi:Flp pilus assembly protein TadD